MSNYQLKHDEYIHEKRKFPIYLVLDNVSDPVNIGSIFRLSDALGVSKIFLCGIDSSIMESKKIKRVSRNTNNIVDFEVFESTTKCIEHIKSNNYKVIALEITNNSISLNTYCFEKNQKYAFVIGNEERGVSDSVLNIVDDSVHIDMYGNNSSMNVSVATGIAVNQCLNKIK